MRVGSSSPVKGNVPSPRGVPFLSGHPLSMRGSLPSQPFLCEVLPLIERCEGRPSFSEGQQTIYEERFPFIGGAASPHLVKGDPPHHLGWPATSLSLFFSLHFCFWFFKFYIQGIFVLKLKMCHVARTYGTWHIKQKSHSIN